jgi:hypothetical protein
VSQDRQVFHTVRKYVLSWGNNRRQHEVLLPWGIRYSSWCRKQAPSFGFCTYMNLMSLSPGVLIVPWTDLWQIHHLQTSNKKINLWSDASDYQSTQDCRHTVLQGLQMNQMKRKEKKNPRITEAAHEDPWDPNSSSYAFEPHLLEITNRICHESKMHTEI